jgi:hypothetical protein
MTTTRQIPSTNNNLNMDEDSPHTKLDSDLDALEMKLNQMLYLVMLDVHRPMSSADRREHIIMGVHQDEYEDDDGASQECKQLQVSESLLRNELAVLDEERNHQLVVPVADGGKKKDDATKNTTTIDTQPSSSSDCFFLCHIDWGFGIQWNTS